MQADGETHLKQETFVPQQAAKSLSGILSNSWKTPKILQKHKFKIADANKIMLQLINFSQNSKF